MRPNLKFAVAIVTVLLSVTTIFAQMPKGMMPPGMMGQADQSEAVNLPERDRPLVHTLPNGMQFLFVENHSSPMVASIVVVRTGSRNETIELCGATHFLEHLLFNGTETRTQQQLYDDMDFLGGYNNANTTHDHTNFMILLEKSNFTAGLKIQAEMLFHSTLPEDKFAKEKGIVTEEIGMGEDREWNQVEDFYNRVLFEGGPYEWPILGSRQSISNMSREQVWDYYKSNYVPNNMVAMIIGDFHTPDMIETVTEIFGNEQPRTLAERKQYQLYSHRVPAYNAEATYVYQGKATSTYLRYTLFAPTRLYPDYHAFVVLVELLQEYLDEKLKALPELGVTDVSVHHFVDIEFALMNVDLTLKADADYHEARKALENLLFDFQDEAHDPDRILAVVNAIKGEELYNAERPHFYGMLKSADLAQVGPYFLIDYMDRLSEVTPEVVEQSAKYYLNYDHGVTSVYQAVKTEKSADLIAIEGEKLARKTLPNGMTIIVQTDRDNPIFAGHFLFKYRSAYEKLLNAKTGSVDFLHRVMEKGPADMPEDEFKATLQRYSARTKFYDMGFIPYDDYYTTAEFSYLRLESLDDYYLPVMEMIAHTLKAPKITEEVIAPIRESVMGMAQRGEGSVSSLGSNLFNDLIYGDHYLAKEIMGTPADVAGYSTDELDQFCTQYCSPQNIILTVLTSHDSETVMEHLEGFFKDWNNISELPQIKSDKPVFEARREEITGGKEQSYLAMGYSFDLIDAADKAPLTIMNSILSDRMQFQLREKEGLAYSLGSSVSFHDDWAVWGARIGTGSQNLARAEEGIIEQVNELQKANLSDDDIVKARNAYLGRLAMRGLTRVNRAYMMGLNELRGQPLDQYNQWMDQLRAVTLSDVQRVMKQYLRADNMTVAIVK
ncbi:MAG: pitrilysin family protein [bacterium]